MGLTFLLTFFWLGSVCPNVASTIEQFINSFRIRKTIIEFWEALIQSLSERPSQWGNIQPKHGRGLITSNQGEPMNGRAMSWGSEESPCRTLNLGCCYLPACTYAKTRS